MRLMLYGFYGCIKKTWLFIRIKFVIFAENDSTIFLGDKEQDANEEQELVWHLYRQFYGRTWASQTHLESTPIDAVSSTQSHL